MLEGVADDSAGAVPAAPAGPQPILAMLAKADVAKGEQISRVCGACHNLAKGGPNAIGPDLYGVVGRPKGAHPGFSYSDGMKAKGGAWTLEDLNHFLWKPPSFIPGTKMTFIGLKKAEDRADLIAYLRTLSASPVALPNAAAIAKEEAELAPPKPAESKDAKPGDKKAGGKTAPADKK
jgi:cytochrome c